MKSFEFLVNNLKSKDSGIRDEAALELMDFGDSKAIPHLIEAIMNPENKNYTGTLVYSLSDYDCSDYIEQLVELCLTGSFEVSSNAFNIIEEFDLTPSILKKVESILLKYRDVVLPHEHSPEAFQALYDLIFNDQV